MTRVRLPASALFGLSRGRISLFFCSCESPEADATSCPDRSKKLYWAATLWPPKYQHHDDRNPTFLLLWPFGFDSPRVHFLAFPVYTTELTFWLFIGSYESPETSDATSCPDRLL